MNALAVFRRTKPEAELADTLAPLVAKRDALAARVTTLRGRAAALDVDEAHARAALETAAAGGEETAEVAEELAKLSARRKPLALETNAAASALAVAEAAVKAEETRLHEADVDARLAELRVAEEKAEAAFKAALIAAGVAYEGVLAAEKAYAAALSAAGRPSGRGFQDSGSRSVTAAESEAMGRAMEARASGVGGDHSHMDYGPAIPFARLLHW